MNKSAAVAQSYHPAERKRQLVQKMHQLKWEGSMQKNAYCFETAEPGQEILSGSWAATSEKNATVQSGWALSCRSG